MLFVLGGNGTHAGANAIHDEVVVPMVICGHLFLSMCTLPIDYNIAEDRYFFGTHQKYFC